MSLLDNLISYWKLDEESGVRYDIHGANHLADNNTVTFTAGKIGNAASFDDLNGEYLSVNDNASLSITSDFSIAFSLKTAGANKYDTGVVDKCDGVTGYGVRLGGHAGAEDSQLLFRVDSMKLLGTTVFQDDVWHFVVVRFDDAANIAEILVDTVRDAINLSATAALADNSYPLRLGNRANQIHAECDLDGELDEVGLWSKWITDEEVATLHNYGDRLPYPFIRKPRNYRRQRIAGLVTTWETGGQ